MDMEEMKQLIFEGIQEIENENKRKGDYSFYRFYIILCPVIFAIALVLLFMVLNHVQLSSSIAKNDILIRLSYVGSILLMSANFLGVLIALWVKPKEWKPK